MFDLKISMEEKFLINVLFNEKSKIEKEVDFNEINYDLLVKIASAHLMLPSLYVNLQNKGFTELIPNDLRIYLKEIYNINHNRNQYLINEANEISEILNKKNINHVFLKGTSHLLKSIYLEIGERMIGDIDILVSQKDYNKTSTLLEKFNYKTSKNITSYAKHGDAFLNIKKKFGVEVHIGLFIKKYKKVMNPDIVLNNKINYKNNFFFLNSKNELLLNIYNYQINDFGSIKLNYSYRSIYDTYMLTKYDKINLDKIKADIYIQNYLLILNELQIPNIKFSKIHLNKINILRFRLKHSNRLYYLTENFIINSFNFIILKQKQIIEIFINRNFREYVIKKILKYT